MQHPVASPPRDPDGSLAGSGFGPREAPTEGASTFHAAQDYPVSAGTPVLAIADATVSAIYWTYAGGWWIMLERPNGDRFGGCHLIRKPSVKVGQRVREGQTIAHVGSTGAATTGPHLHFVVQVDGVNVDPVEYIGDSSLTHPAPGRPAGGSTPTPGEIIMSMTPYPHIIRLTQANSHAKAGQLFLTTHDSVRPLTQGQLDMLGPKFDADPVELDRGDLEAYADAHGMPYPGAFQPAKPWRR